MERAFSRRQAEAATATKQQPSRHDASHPTSPAPARNPLWSQLTYGNQLPASLRLSPEPVQRKQNTTGLPDTLKTGIENLSGLSLDDVHVHYHSSKPAQVQALAYTQGTDIHVAPGQEQHLAHEAWHVVQQKQGRVQATMQAKGVAVNDDQALEQEADSVAHSIHGYASTPSLTERLTPSSLRQPIPPIQRMLTPTNSGETEDQATFFKDSRASNGRGYRRTQPGPVPEVIDLVDVMATHYQYTKATRQYTLVNGEYWDPVREQIYQATGDGVYYHVHTDLYYRYENYLYKLIPLDITQNGWTYGGEYFPHRQVMVANGKVVGTRARTGTTGGGQAVHWDNNALVSRFTLTSDRAEGNTEAFHPIPVVYASSSDQAKLPPKPLLPTNTVGYLATVPVPMKQKTADLAPSVLYERYVAAFGIQNASTQLRLVVGVNLLDNPLDTTHDTSAYKETLQHYVREQFALTNSSPILAIFGYLLRPPVRDAWTNRPVSVDYVREVSKLTADVNYNYAMKFPFAGIREDMATNSQAQRFLTQLRGYNRNVFIHTGDSDLVSLHPQGHEKPSLFQNFSAVIQNPAYQDTQGRSVLARAGGSYAFSPQEVRTLVVNPDSPQGKQQILLTLLINAVDQEFRAIMSSGNTPAGWFAEPNTLINAALLENELTSVEITSALGQEEAFRHAQMPDYFLAFHETLLKLRGKLGKTKDPFEEQRQVPAWQQVPKQSLFLAGPEFRLVTSARHDIQDPIISGHGGAEATLKAAASLHNVQFRSSQFSTLANVSYRISVNQAGQMFGGNFNSIDLGPMNKQAFAEIQQKMGVYQKLVGLALAAIRDIEQDRWEPGAGIAKLRTAVQAELEAIRLSGPAPTGASKLEGNTGMSISDPQSLGKGSSSFSEAQLLPTTDERDIVVQNLIQELQSTTKEKLIPFFDNLMKAATWLGEQRVSMLLGRFLTHGFLLTRSDFPTFQWYLHMLSKLLTMAQKDIASSVIQQKLDSAVQSFELSEQMKRELWQLYQQLRLKPPALLTEKQLAFL